MNKIQESVQHIEKIHANLYSKTTNKSLLAGKKSMLRLNQKEIKELETKIKSIRKENNKLRSEIAAYIRITKDNNK